MTSKAGTRGIRSKTNKPLFWLLTVTWKRRKGKPSEIAAVCTGGVIHVLFLHKELAKHLHVPESWVAFKLRSEAEFKRLAPEFYEQWVASSRTSPPQPVTVS